MSPPPRRLTNRCALVAERRRARAARAAGRRGRAAIASRPIGTSRSLEPLPRARRTPASRSMSPTSSPIASRGAQAAGVHQLEQRAVAQRGRLGARAAPRAAARPRRGVRTCGSFWLLRGARRSAVGSCVDDRPRAAGGGRRSAGRRPCAAASRARGRALVGAGGELVEEAGEVGVLGRRARRRRGARNSPNCSRSRAVGLERVARQPALELQVGEEVEHVVLERAWRRSPGCDGHGAWFAAAAPSPRGARRVRVQRGRSVRSAGRD